MGTTYEYDDEAERRQEQTAMSADMVAQREFVRSVLALKPGERVLEVGCGNGYMVREMAGEVGAAGHVSGLDFAEGMVAKAGALCQAIPHADFRQGDAGALPFEDAAFDAVTGMQVYCFVGEIDKALSEAHRVLKPGGRLVIQDTEWSGLAWNHPDDALMNRVAGALRGVYADAHLPRTLTRRMNSAGFTNVGCDVFTVVNRCFASSTYSYQLANSMQPIIEADPAFTTAEMQAWFQGLQDLDAAGDYFFSLNRYVFSGTKA
jgi:ubiquinone/menaquinone biosynthesis C-methylase UbiE